MSLQIALFHSFLWLSNILLLLSCSVVPNSLQPYGLQHTRLPCPSPSPWIGPSSYPLNQWCHPTISSSVIPFSSWPQSFPASGFFPMSQLFESGGFPGNSAVKNSPANAGDTRNTGSILGWENPLEKEIATHSNTFAWKIPWAEEPGGL